MKVFYSDQFVLPLPEGHRFPMKKYSMLRERVERDGICGPGELRVPQPVTDEEILRAHEGAYLEKVVSGKLTDKEMRRIGFPWSKRMVERSRRASGGSFWEQRSWGGNPSWYFLSLRVLVKSALFCLSSDHP